MEASKPHAALLSSPGMGHLIPVLELGKRFVTYHGFNVTVFVVATHSSSAEDQLLLQSTMTPKILEIVKLPPIDISSLVDPDAAIVTWLAVMMREAVPSVRKAITAMKIRPTTLIVDFLGTDSLVIADELRIRKYVYLSSNAWFLALTIYMPILDKVVEGEYLDQKEPLELPGCKPVHPEDVVDPMLDRTNQQYHEYVRMGSQIPKCDGILVNTWEDLESMTLGALRNNEVLSRVVKVAVYPIGPVIRPVGPTGSSRSDILDWLDMQPKESVIYVSFGSGGTLSTKQLTELACGLELSQQRFIWVVRPPAENDTSASFLTAGNGGGGDNNASYYLSDGFLTRTQHVGLVVPNWAPQREILSHPSIGAFLSHCGWNSALESILNGVPMIAWPLYAEQRMNAVMLTEEIGVALRPEVLPVKKVVMREEIEKMVRKIMERDQGNNRMRVRVKELKYSAEMALMKGGSSYNSLSQVAEACHN